MSVCLFANSQQIRYLNSVLCTFSTRINEHPQQSRLRAVTPRCRYLRFGSYLFPSKNIEIRKLHVDINTLLDPVLENLYKLYYDSCVSENSPWRVREYRSSTHHKE